ncbi:MAG TPA: UDP-N-acetylmuramoyl-L-alanine--D-glutamate ligase [Alphaproteobacteria bacterium]|nr:UDP-N-acetylmuramoyl-L-alanine--D-glutamate ligase [Alphaproteobacteria bacterium]
MIDLSAYAKTLNGKPIAVFGLGVSGLSVVKALVAADIAVTAWDDSEDGRDKAKDLGAAIDDLTKIDLSGYAALILAPGVPYSFEPHPVVLNAQKYGIEIIGDLELLHRSGHGIKTIGITGTNGKSTTTALMTHVLNACGMKAVMGGNIGKAVCDIDMAQGIDVLVLEISSYQMDLCPTYRPDISILLNITPDHLDRHGSMKAYVEAKGRILEGGGVAIIGVDDDFTQKLFDQAFCQGQRKLIPVSMKSEIPEGLFVENGVLYENNRGENHQIGVLKNDDFENLKGVHNYQNATCVLAAARALGIADQDVLAAFKTYPGLPHRQYLVGKKGHVTYINDSKATNAEAAAKALSSYDHIYWIIGGRPKKNGLEGLEIFKDKIVKTYVIGEASEAFSAWLQYYGFGHELCQTLDAATKKAHVEAQADSQDSVVLLSPACASWDQYPSFEVRGNEFMNQVKALIGEGE